MIVKDYQRADGISPFRNWIDKLDGSLKARVTARTIKIRDTGHFGVCKIIGKNLYELKFKNLGGGIRIYFGENDKEIILLLGGNKQTQEDDIKKIKVYCNDYLLRFDEE